MGSDVTHRSSMTSFSQHVLDPGLGDGDVLVNETDVVPASESG